jgi:hypothetical protein
MKRMNDIFMAERWNNHRIKPYKRDTITLRNAPRPSQQQATRHDKNWLSSLAERTWIMSLLDTLSGMGGTCARTFDDAIIAA